METASGVTEKAHTIIKCANRVSQFDSGPCLWDEYQTLAKQYSPCNLGNSIFTSQVTREQLVNSDPVIINK